MLFIYWFIAFFICLEGLLHHNDKCTMCARRWVVGGGGMGVNRSIHLITFTFILIPLFPLEKARMPPDPRETTQYCNRFNKKKCISRVKISFVIYLFKKVPCFRGASWWKELRFSCSKYHPCVADRLQLPCLCIDCRLHNKVHVPYITEFGFEILSAKTNVS